MKKKLLGIFLALAIGMLLSVVACAPDSTSGGPKNENVSVTGIAFKEESLDLLEGQEMTLEYAISPQDATDKSVTFSSSVPTCVSVDEQGKIKALAIGDAVITVTTKDGSFTDVCAVSVSSAWDEGVVTLEPTCEEEGVMTFTNRVTQETRTEPIDALGHDFVFSESVDATYTESAYDLWVCSRDPSHTEKRNIHGTPIPVPIEKEAENCTFSVPTSAQYNTTVEITDIRGLLGYSFAAISVTAGSEVLEVTQTENGYSFIMPAQAVSVMVSFEPDTDIPYTVKYYVQDIFGEYGEPVKVTELTGTADSTVTVMDYDSVPETHELDEELSDDKTVQIAADGSTVVELYYKYSATDRVRVYSLDSLAGCTIESLEAVFGGSISAGETAMLQLRTEENETVYTVYAVVGEDKSVSFDLTNVQEDIGGYNAVISTASSAEPEIASLSATRTETYNVSAIYKELYDSLASDASWGRVTKGNVVFTLQGVKKFALDENGYLRVKTDAGISGNSNDWPFYWQFTGEGFKEAVIKTTTYTAKYMGIIMYDTNSSAKRELFRNLANSGPVLNSSTNTVTSDQLLSDPKIYCLVYFNGTDGESYIYIEEMLVRYTVDIAADAKKDMINANDNPASAASPEEITVYEIANTYGTAAGIIAQTNAEDGTQVTATVYRDGKSKGESITAQASAGVLEYDVSELNLQGAFSVAFSGDAEITGVSGCSAYTLDIGALLNESYAVYSGASVLDEGSGISAKFINNDAYAIDENGKITVTAPSGYAKSYNVTILIDFVKAKQEGMQSFSFEVQMKHINCGPDNANKPCRDSLSVKKGATTNSENISTIVKLSSDPSGIYSETFEGTLDSYDQICSTMFLGTIIDHTLSCGKDCGVIYAAPDTHDHKDIDEYIVIGDMTVTYEYTAESSILYL